MKMLRFDYFCDNKAAEHPPLTVQADTILVYSPGKERVVHLDVCDDCLDHLTHHEVSELADKYGRDIEAPGGETSLVCPFGCNDSKPFKSKGGKARHMTVKHPDWAPDSP